jgi:hypothetical protein
MCTTQDSIPSFATFYNVSACHRRAADARTEADGDPGKVAASTKEPSTVSQTLCPLCALRPQCEARPRGQQRATIPGSLPEARAAKHFAETCDRSDRSDRGRVRTPRHTGVVTRE